MKTLLKITSLWIVLVASVSCQSNTSESANLKTLDAAITTSETATADAPIASGGYLSCKVDGVLLEAAYPGIMILYVPAKKEANIWGKTPTGIISIIIDKVESTGTFTIKGNSKNGAGIMSGKTMYEVKKTGTPFTVTISSMENLTAINSTSGKAIKGTFQGKLMGPDGKLVEITEGKFSTQ